MLQRASPRPTDDGEELPRRASTDRPRGSTVNGQAVHDEDAQGCGVPWMVFAG